MPSARSLVPLLAALATASTFVFARQAGRVARRRFGVPPRRPVSSETPAGGQDVAIVGANGLTLRGWLLMGGNPGAAPGPAVVVMHGWGSSAGDMLPVASVLAVAGLHTLVLDARCHGRSDGDDFASMPRFAEDVEAAVGWLRAQSFVDPAAVALIGHSVGAGACLLAASRDPRVAGVVSVSSMANPAHYMSAAMARQGIPRWLRRAALRYVETVIGHRYVEFAPEHTIARLGAPVLLVHGDNDRTVSIADAHRLREASRRRPSGEQPARLIVVEGAGHSTLDALLTVAGEVVEFVREAVHASALE